MEVFDPNDDDIQPVLGGCGHSAKQLRDSANACWYAFGILLTLATIAGIIKLCDWLVSLF